MIASGVQLASDTSLWSSEALMALVALTAMEIVLGIDNIVFIAIITGRLPEEQRSMARRFGLALAMIMRIILLMMIGWLMGLEGTLFELSQFAPTEALAEQLAEDPEINQVSGRDLILLFGGLFSPLADGLLNIDLAKQFDSAKLLIVAANRLGVIHQVLATCEASKQQGSAPSGIILCQPTPDSDESVLTNHAEIERYSDVPVIGSVAYGETTWSDLSQIE